MKYDDFAQLCDREWTAEPPFGDVTALSLTGPSAAELAAEAFGSGGPVEFTGPDGEPLAGPPAGACGIGLTEIVNPVTRSVAKVTAGAESDTATVSYGNFEWSPPPRTVALA
jgi:hypothetical protein